MRLRRRTKRTEITVLHLSMLAVRKRVVEGVLATAPVESTFDHTHITT